MFVVATYEYVDLIIAIHAHLWMLGFKRLYAVQRAFYGSFTISMSLINYC